MIDPRFIDLKPSASAETRTRAPAMARVETTRASAGHAERLVRER